MAFRDLDHNFGNAVLRLHVHLVGNRAPGAPYEVHGGEAEECVEGELRVEGEDVGEAGVGFYEREDGGDCAARALGLGDGGKRRVEARVGGVCVSVFLVVAVPASSGAAALAFGVRVEGLPDVFVVQPALALLMYPLLAVA
jgi:hypothetical protein